GRHDPLATNARRLRGDFAGRLKLRGHSSAGRALAWHARGRRLDPAWLHQPSRATRDPAAKGPRRRGRGAPLARRKKVPPHASTIALSRSRSATISFFTAVSSATEHCEAARIDGGTD